MLTVQVTPAEVLKKWGFILSDAFIEQRLMPNFTLADLPELLVGGNPRLRRAATKRAEQLERSNDER